jgi:hypothetical protein
MAMTAAQLQRKRTKHNQKRKGKQYNPAKGTKTATIVV